MRRRFAACLALALLAGAVAWAAQAPPDVYTLKNGDRVSGRTVIKGRKAFTVQTPWGRLNIPRGEVARVTWSDGREEVFVAEPEPSPTPTPEPPRLTLVVALAGRSFWQAWDPRRTPPADPTLRLALWLDEELLAAYTDTRPDPDDLPGALVNTFDFTAPAVAVEAVAPVLAEPPEVRPGRVTLRLRLPATLAGEHRLRLAYQVNDGTAGEPAWRDAAGTSLLLQLRAEGPSVAELQQDPGRMEYSRKRMRNTETFRLAPVLDTPASQP